MVLLAAGVGFVEYPAIHVDQIGECRTVFFEDIARHVRLIGLAIEVGLASACQKRRETKNYDALFHMYRLFQN